jgi:hypothetical protein
MNKKVTCAVMALILGLGSTFDPVPHTEVAVFRRIPDAGLHRHGERRPWSSQRLGKLEIRGCC